MNVKNNIIARKLDTTQDQLKREKRAQQIESAKVEMEVESQTEIENMRDKIQN